MARDDQVGEHGADTWAELKAVPAESETMKQIGDIDAGANNRKSIGGEPFELRSSSELRWRREAPGGL